MKVKATKKFMETNRKPKELDHIPVENEIFEISQERLGILKDYVVVVEEAKVEVPETATVKKTTKKKSA